MYSKTKVVNTNVAWSIYDFEANKDVFFEAWSTDAVQEILHACMYRLYGPNVWRKGESFWQLSDIPFWEANKPPETGSLESLILRRNDNSTMYIAAALEATAAIMFPDDRVMVSHIVDGDPYIMLYNSKIVFSLRDSIFSGALESDADYSEYTYKMFVLESADSWPGVIHEIPGEISSDSGTYKWGTYKWKCVTNRWFL